MRFVLASLLGDPGPDFESIKRWVPDIYETSDRDLLRTPRPRVMKSHEYFDPSCPRVLYLVRDPLDVVVSYHTLMLKRGRVPADLTLDEFVTRFVEGSLDGFGTWAQHVGSWTGALEGRTSRFLLLRYEDLRAKTHESVAAVAKFAGLGNDQPLINRAVEAARHSRMLGLAEEWKGKGPSPYVGQGSVGTPTDKLGERNVTMIRSAFLPQLLRLGYIDEVSRGTASSPGLP